MPKASARSARARCLYRVQPDADIGGLIARPRDHVHFLGVSPSQTGAILAGGATVDLHGAVYLAWAGYTRRDGAKGRENCISASRSMAASSWTTRLMDASGAPPDCGAYRCEWGYLGAQITMTSDAAGTLYALWNSGAADKSPRESISLPPPQPVKPGRQG